MVRTLKKRQDDEEEEDPFTDDVTPSSDPSDFYDEIDEDTREVQSRTNQIQNLESTWAEIHQALLSKFSLLAEFFIEKVAVKE